MLLEKIEFLSNIENKTSEDIKLLNNLQLILNNIKNINNFDFVQKYSNNVFKILEEDLMFFKNRIDSKETIDKDILTNRETMFKSNLKIMFYLNIISDIFLSNIVEDINNKLLKNNLNKIILDELDEIELNNKFYDDLYLKFLDIKIEDDIDFLNNLINTILEQNNNISFER